jgi:hypothetical protein
VEAHNLKKIIWENVRALMVERWGRENLLRLAREAKIGEASVNRIKEARTSVGVDILEAIAKVLRVAPHILLVPPREKETAKLISDDSFKLVSKAYTETDDRGREILIANAQILLNRLEREQRPKRPGEGQQ